MLLEFLTLLVLLSFVILSTIQYFYGKNLTTVDPLNQKFNKYYQYVDNIEKSVSKIENEFNSIKNNYKIDLGITEFFNRQIDKIYQKLNILKCGDVCDKIEDIVFKPVINTIKDILGELFSLLEKLYQTVNDQVKKVFIQIFDEILSIKDDIKILNNLKNDLVKEIFYLQNNIIDILQYIIVNSSFYQILSSLLFQNKYLISLFIYFPIYLLTFCIFSGSITGIFNIVSKLLLDGQILN